MIFSCIIKSMHVAIIINCILYQIKKVVATYMAKNIAALIVQTSLLTYIITYVTGFGKTDHIVTIDISRNTDLKY